MSKVKYNLKNVHIAQRTETDAGITYADPVPFKGAKSVSLEAQGDIVKTYADGIVYYQTASNTGYEGDLEMMLITDAIRKLIYSETEDAKKVLFEDSNAKPKSFALLFEIDTDEKATRFVFYNCTATRPSVESETIEESTEPGTETMKISCAPEADGTIRAKTTDETDETAYNSWYTAVYTKTEAQG